MQGAAVEPERRESVGTMSLPLLAAASALSVVVSRRTAGAFWGTSYLVLGTALVAAAWLWRVHTSLGPGWNRWRRAIPALAALTLIYPGLWAVVALLDHESPGRRLTWAFAVLAGIAHLPFLASF